MKRYINIRNSMEMRVGITSIFLYLSLVLLSQAASQIEIIIEPNQYYHESNDPFSIHANLNNSGPAASVDFYFALEIGSDFYFYPSFGTDPDFSGLTLQPGSTSIEIIPTVILPSELPLISGNLYSICTEPGNYNLASNVAVCGIRINSDWNILPFPDSQNTFYLMPGDHRIDFSASQDAFDEFANVMSAHFPLQGPYMRHGISLIDPIGSETQSATSLLSAEKAFQANLALCLHVGLTNHHTYGSLEAQRSTDRRLSQWESDGRTYNDGSEDFVTITPSRYARDIFEMRERLTKINAQNIKSTYTQYPDTLVCINGPIEVEMRRSLNDNPHFADYSPFIIAEFRDWLRHANKYDDASGAFKGEGASQTWFADIPTGFGSHNFSIDPSPEEHIGEGLSFNEVFGTDFTSWDLKYWDPVIFPDPLDYSANPMPAGADAGHIDNGFDAPREVNAVLIGGNAYFQKMWDGYRNEYGYGFRQIAIQHYVSDSAKWYAESGVPGDLIYSHQIPADFIGNWIRLKGSASPFWTAITPFCNAGFTAYWSTSQQEMLFELTRQFSPRWGLFEYHPDPYMTSDVSYFLSSLELLYEHRCQIIVPLEIESTPSGSYRLINTPFETALDLFFSASFDGTDKRRFDQPYFNEEWQDFLPPSLNDVTFVSGTLSWSPFIWQDRPDITWQIWGEFDHFDICRGTNPDFTPNPGNRILSTNLTSIADLDPAYFYKVVAVAKTGLTSHE